MKPRVLIVSPHFPPVNAPDMQRGRMSLPYFVEAGWEVTVLTVADPTPSAPVEPELGTTVPAAVRVVRCICLSRRWTGLLGINNVALRALPFLFLAGCRLLSARRFDVVYFSTTMFIVLPFGRLWKLLYGVPCVIDLQDPWVSDFYDRPGAPPPPGGWKYGVAQNLARALEGWSLRGAGQLIAVSGAYITTLRQRYPWLASTPATIVPFGSPDSDLALLRSRLPSLSPLLPAGGIRLAFAGALGPGMLAAVEVLFAAMQEARRTGLDVSAHFFGTSYAPDSSATPAILALAATHGLADHVREQPRRLRYFDALQVTLEADANLVFGSTDLPYTPSKLLALLAAGPPVLAIAPAGSALVSRLAELGRDCTVFPRDTATWSGQAEIVGKLCSLAGPAGGRTAPASPFSARTAALQQLAILREVAATTAPGGETATIR